MFNRYLDGLATWAPEDPQFYRERGAKVAREGYTAVNRELIAPRSAASGS